MSTLLLLNNFLHDFSAAGWIFSSVLLWRILKKTAALDTVDKTLIDTVKTIILLMNISLGGIIVLGLVRALVYRSFEWNEAAGQSQITLLIVKHLVLTVIFVFGLVYYIRAYRLVKKESCRNRD